MAAISPGLDFPITRFGVIMSPQTDQPREAWGVLNPAGVRSADGALHLFPRLIAEGNYSRIGHARVCFDGDRPVGVERLGVALEPREPYEVSAGGGGLEDPRVVYIPAIKRYVMTYTAFVPYEPKVAVAVSEDLETWQRLGVLRYAEARHAKALQLVGNKDAAFFPDVVLDPSGVPSLGILHRPTARIRFAFGGRELIMPPKGRDKRESIWISYIPVEDVLADVANLTAVRRHERVLAPKEPWEAIKVGGGAPPVRIPSGWLLTYHGVSSVDGHLRYSMGVAILDARHPSRVLFRSQLPILEPEMDYERSGLTSNVVFPSATDLRPSGEIDVYYGAADRVIAAARMKIPGPLLTAPPEGLGEWLVHVARHIAEGRTPSRTRS
jgi:predicted GH43/DUF377 family glycosyl hydrolase